MTESNIYSAVVLDDDEIIIKTLTSALKRRGLIAYGTTNQDEYFKLISNQKPTFACIDLNMPRMNGIEVIKKSYEIIPDLKVIVVSGYVDMYNDDLKELGVSVVNKGARYLRDLEKVICKELEIKEEKFQSLADREKTNYPHKILIVDDEEEVHKYVKELAEAENINMDYAHSFEEAVAKVKSFKPDILLADLFLVHKKDGDELIKYLKALDPPCSLKLYVGMTGAMGEKKRLQDVNVDDLLLKPTPLNEFFKALARWEELIAKKDQKS